METLSISRTKFEIIAIDIKLYKKRRSVPMSKIYEIEMAENE